MNKYKLHTLINSAKSILEDDNAKSGDLRKIFQIIANEIQDPFASSIDEFLMEKESKKDTPTKEEEVVDNNDTVEEEESVEEHPQDGAIDTLKEEAFDYKSPTEQEHPQDKLEDKVDVAISDEAEEETEETEETEEAEEAEEEAEEAEETLEKDKNVESALKKIADEIAFRGYSHIAKKFVKASSVSVIENLNDLLMQEFLIRDILENYVYLFEPSQALQLVQYKPKDSIIFLQKQIVFLGGRPTPQRFTIPPMNTCSYSSMLGLVKEANKKLIQKYSSVISSLGCEDKYLTLKVMLQKIMEKNSAKSDRGEYEVKSTCGVCVE